MSGGTLIALAADEIVMSRHAVLGPIDPQLGQSPAASLLKVVEQKPIAEIDDQTLVMADVGTESHRAGQAVCQRFLKRRLPEDSRSPRGEAFDWDMRRTTTPLFAATAKELGLPVSAEMPNDVLELMKLYPQPVRTQSGGGVEYLPVPRRKEPVSREA